MIEPDDETVARRPTDDATVVSRRLRPDAQGQADRGTSPSPTSPSPVADETVIRPRTGARAAVRDEPGDPAIPPRRAASSGQPHNTVYGPRTADPVIVPRTHR